ncbi:MAG: Crp/Fnr family transcriptional regulator [Betaproteobacteria bacterium]|nr:Crp/Fnr family transcriptional regulator [Betaproteobacteria bacterium]
MTALAQPPASTLPAPKTSELFQNMLPAYFPAELRKASSLFRAAAGERLFEAGAAVQACYRVDRGRVSLFRQVADGGRIVLQQANEGDWLIEPGPYDRTVSCSAVADRATALRIVPVRPFRKALQEDAAFANAWARETALTARRLQRTVERLTLSLASERVLHYVATEADANTGELVLDFPLCEWARRLGMKGETLSRVLGEMEAGGALLRTGRRGFRLPARGTRRA